MREKTDSVTNRELNRLHGLNREIEEEGRMLRALEDAAKGNTAGSPGMPGAAAGEDCAALIARQRERITRRVEQAWREFDRLNGFIQDVEDPRMRHIMTLRHVRGLTWRQIASAVDGRADTEDAIKKGYYRFLQKKKTCPECPGQVL